MRVSKIIIPSPLHTNHPPCPPLVSFELRWYARWKSASFDPGGTDYGVDTSSSLSFSRYAFPSFVKLREFTGFLDFTDVKPCQSCACFQRGFVGFAHLGLLFTGIRVSRRGNAGSSRGPSGLRTSISASPFPLCRFIYSNLTTVLLYNLLTGKTDQDYGTNPLL
ncbi:hypothetical protein R1flu_020251 [Riccia fluitans]|uniref:Uncharacterized protein n=1 Tax=Riccia fluitans TaxID=41844 RepID=A0ABD1ZL18_9MARC